MHSANLWQKDITDIYLKVDCPLFLLSWVDTVYWNLCVPSSFIVVIGQHVLSICVFRAAPLSMKYKSSKPICRIYICVSKQNETKYLIYFDKCLFIGDPNKNLLWIGQYPRLFQTCSNWYGYRQMLCIQRLRATCPFLKFKKRRHIKIRLK